MIGGTERYVSDAISALAPLGVSSRWLTSNRHSAGRPQSAAWGSIGTVGPSWYMTTPSRRRLRQEVARADLLHVHDLRFCFPALVSAARSAGVPVVVSTHGLIFHNDRRRILKALVWRWSLAPRLRAVDAVLADSQADLDLCRSKGVGDRARLFENPVGVDRLTGASAAIDARPDVNEQHLRVLCFGRLDANKNVAAAVALCNLDDDLTLRVAGPGSAREVERLVQLLPPSRRGQLHVLGELSDRDLEREMRQADCIVFPSTFEGFGLALVEAMASGRPVVANDIAPYRTVVGDSGVRICDVNDAAEFLAAVRDASTSHPVQRAMARAATYSWAHRAPELVKIYEEICGG